MVEIFIFLFERSSTSMSRIQSWRGHCWWICNDWTDCLSLKLWESGKLCFKIHDRVGRYMLRMMIHMVDVISNNLSIKCYKFRGLRSLTSFMSIFSMKNYVELVIHVLNKEIFGKNIVLFVLYKVLFVNLVKYFVAFSVFRVLIIISDGLKNNTLHVPAVGAKGMQTMMHSHNNYNMVFPKKNMALK